MSEEAKGWRFPTAEEMQAHRVARLGAQEVERLDRVAAAAVETIRTAFANGVDCVVLTSGGRELSRIYADGRTLIYES